jgi:hypothetical protein
MEREEEEEQEERFSYIFSLPLLEPGHETDWNEKREQPDFKIDLNGVYVHKVTRQLHIFAFSVATCRWG